MYAVFHPKSTSSTFREFVLHHVELMHDTTETVGLMRTNTMLRFAPRNLSTTSIATSAQEGRLDVHNTPEARVGDCAGRVDHASAKAQA